MTTDDLPGMMPHADIAEGWDVPSFRYEPLRPRRTKYVIVIPVINEGERIRGQLREMARLGIHDLVDTVVVDGGSTDGSLDSDFLSSVGVPRPAGKNRTGAVIRPAALCLCVGIA